MNWKQTNIPLGVLRVGQVTTVIFNYIGTDKIISTKAGCGCSVPIWNPINNELKVVYTPNPIPYHLLQQNKNSYHSDKYILVTYDNGNVDKLIFTATITK